MWRLSFLDSREEREREREREERVGGARGLSVGEGAKDHARGIEEEEAEAE